MALIRYRPRTRDRQGKLPLYIILPDPGKMGRCPFRSARCSTCCTG